MGRREPQYSWRAIYGLRARRLAPWKHTAEFGLSEILTKIPNRFDVLSISCILRYVVEGDSQAACRVHFILEDRNDALAVSRRSSALVTVTHVTCS